MLLIFPGLETWFQRKPLEPKCDLDIVKSGNKESPDKEDFDSILVLIVFGLCSSTVLA